MDKELQDLFKSGTLNLSVGMKYSNRAKKLLQWHRLSAKSIILLGMSIVSRQACACTGICSMTVTQTMKCLHLLWNGQLSGCSFHYQLQKDGPQLLLTSRTPLLKPPYLNQFTWSFLQDMSRQIQEPGTRSWRSRRACAVTAAPGICGIACYTSLLSKIWDSHALKWVDACLLRRTALWCCMRMMWLSSPKVMLRLSMCCSSSMTSIMTFCMTRLTNWTYVSLW